jgi:hypothetical protein
VANKFNLNPILKAIHSEEAIAYFRQKGYRVGFDHRDVWQQEHQAAFTVAKAMQLDVLADIRAQVDAALANGTTFAQFKRELTPKLQARGWWGKQEMVDPLDGETKRVQLGSPKRLELIYDTNLATAYSEGQWERIQRNKALFPFLEYVRSASTNPRHTHLAYAGLVLPADDPFWATHMPVKEFRCKCSVIQHTGRTLEREGLAVGKAPPEVMRTVLNKRTGEVMQVPTGVDPAFHYPPGGRRANLGRMMMDKADAATATTAARVLATGKERWLPVVQSEFAEFVGRYALGERPEVGKRRVVGVFSPEVVDGLAAAGKLPQHATIFTNLQKLHHLIGDNRSDVRKAKGTGVAFVSSLPSLLQQTGEAWLDGQRVVLLCTAPNELGRVVKVVVDLAAPVREEVVGNAVVSMELIPPRDFQRKGLTRLHKE